MAKKWQRNEKHFADLFIFLFFIFQFSSFGIYCRCLAGLLQGSRRQAPRASMPIADAVIADINTGWLRCRAEISI